MLNKELHDGRFDMTVRVDETKRDIVVSRFDAVPRGCEQLSSCESQYRHAACSSRGVPSTVAQITRYGSRLSPGRQLVPASTMRRSPRLRLVPQLIHLVQRRLLQRASLRRQRALDIGKAALELGVGAAERHFRIGVDVAREIDQREQEVAGLFRQLLRVVAIERGLDLVGFLADLVQHRARVVPVEADGGGLALQFHARASARAGRPSRSRAAMLCVCCCGRRAARSAFSSALMRSHGF